MTIIAVSSQIKSSSYNPFSSIFQVQSVILKGETLLYTILPEEQSKAPKLKP